MGFFLVFPHRRSAFHRSSLRLPEPGRGDWSYLVDFLNDSSLTGPLTSLIDPTYTRDMLTRNSRLHDKAEDAGGTFYPIGASPMPQPRWIRHYGTHWPLASARKRRYDADRILTPGPGIF